MISSLDLNGTFLTVATNLSPPYVFLEDNYEYIRWNLSGFEIRLLHEMEKRFNFSHKIVTCNNDWGVQIDNDSWTGIIGKIVSKEAHIGLGGLTITEERSRYVNFTEPHIITTVSYVTPPPKNKPNMTLVIEPFDSLVWLFIILALVLVLSTEGLIRRCVHYDLMRVKWGIISLLLKQKMDCDPPTFLQLRILLYFWTLATLVLTSSYGGRLYSLMTIPSRAKPIDELTELAAEQRRGQIRVTAIGGSSYFESLKRANYGVYKELGKYLEAIKNKEQGIIAVINASKPTAYISTRDSLVYGLTRFGSEYLYLPPPTQESTLFIDLMGIAFQKDFKYRNHFNKLIKSLKIGGFLDYWRHFENRILVSKMGVKPLESSEDLTYYRVHDVLQIYQLQSALYLFTFCIFLSILLLFIELLLNNRELKCHSMHSSIDKSSTYRKSVDVESNRSTEENLESN